MSDEFKVTEGNITLSFAPPPGAEGKRIAEMCWELWRRLHMAEAPSEARQAGKVLKRIVRDRRLTPEEVAEDQKPASLLRISTWSSSRASMPRRWEFPLASLLPATGRTGLATGMSGCTCPTSCCGGSAWNVRTTPS